MEAASVHLIPSICPNSRMGPQRYQQSTAANLFLDHDPHMNHARNARSPSPTGSQSTPLPRSNRKRVPQRTESIEPTESMSNTRQRDIVTSASSSNTTSPRTPTDNAASLPPLHLVNLKSDPNPGTTASPMTPNRAPRVDRLKDPQLHQTFQFKGVPGGRLRPHRVGFAQYGTTDRGHAAIVIGGHGCTRLVGVMFEELALRYAVHMIWPERPGYGLSEECSSQEMSALEWAEVVIQLADHLHLKRFSIIAQSVGTVFALAIAHKYPSRIIGPIFVISPWVSTQAANTFKWSRRLPAPLVTRTVSLAMDVMWMFNRGLGSKESSGRTSTSDEDAEPLPNSHTATPLGMSSKTWKEAYDAMTELEEDELLASLDDDNFDLPTDFPPHRPLRHVVRPRHVSLYLAMNKLRMSEPSTQGQLLDVLIALEKYNSFGFNYSEIKSPVSAVWGDKDGLIPQRAIDTLASSLRDVRLKILDGEGHDLVWKEGVMEWAIRGISEQWSRRLRRMTKTLSTMR